MLLAQVPYHYAAAIAAYASALPVMRPLYIEYPTLVRSAFD